MAYRTPRITHRHDTTVRLTRLKVHKIELLTTPHSVLGLHPLNEENHIKTVKFPNPRQPQPSPPPPKEIILETRVVTHPAKLADYHYAIVLQAD